MGVFVDTSALYAALSTRDDCHGRARTQWTGLLKEDGDLVTSNYVLVETVALLGRRLGLQAVRDFQTAFVPILDVFWIEAVLHERALSALLAANTRELSLVDCASFEVMRTLALETAFAFDDHFRVQGFHMLPEV